MDFFAIFVGGKLDARNNLQIKFLGFFFGGFYSGTDIAASIEKHLKVMELWERRDNRVGTFSKGMKHRLALVRALLPEPKVLFLDEPTAGLDPEAAAEVRGIIRALSGEGRTIFLSTHNLAEAEQLCRRIAVIRTHLVAVDSPQNLRRRFFRREIIVRLQALAGGITAAVKALQFVPWVQATDYRIDNLIFEPGFSTADQVTEVSGRGSKDSVPVVKSTRWFPLMKMSRGVSAISVVDTTSASAAG
jgi:ABC-2 type transport system ATP-binding protein